MESEAALGCGLARVAVAERQPRCLGRPWPRRRGHSLAIIYYDLFEGAMIRICEWCSRAYEVIRSGPGRPPPSCSAACKHEAQNALAKGRMARMRARKAEQQPMLRRP
jgi:hypothetical protein